MSNDMIRYDFGTIESGRADIANSVTQFNSTLADLKSYLQPLVSTWQGEAAEAYTVQQQKWDRAAEDLNLVLSQISSAVGRGNDAMFDANRRAAASWS